MSEREIASIDPPARLAVAAAAEQQLGPALDRLAAARFLPSAARRDARLPTLVELPAPGNLEAAANWLRDNDDAHLLLLFNAPLPALAQQIARGFPPTEALEKWRADAERILAIARRYRRRVSLLPMEELLADPAACLQALGERFGLAVEVPQATERPAAPAGALVRMMAEHAAWQSIEVRQLAAELEASALPAACPPELLPPTADEVFEEFKAVYEQARLESTRDLAGLREENELLLQQLHQVQKELASRAQDNQELKQKLEAAEAAAIERAPAASDFPQEEKARLEARNKDLEEEHELLLHQLHQVQQELESYYLEGVGTRQELEEARATIEAVFNSRSWKLTRPLRWFLETFMGAESAAR